MSTPNCSIRVYGPAFRSLLDLRGFRFMTDPAPAGAGDPPADPPAGDPPAGDSAPWTKDNFDPERAWRLTENLRKDLAEQKTKTDAAIAAAATKAAEDAQKATLKEFAKLLGGGEQVETDPEKLRASLTEMNGKLTESGTALANALAAAKAAEVKALVAVHAGPLGANTSALLSNEAFKTSIASVEPTDEAAIKAAITQALQANAALKQPPARSGDGDHTGPTVQSLEAQLKAAEEKKDQAEIIRLTRAVVHAKQRQA